MVLALYILYDIFRPKAMFIYIDALSECNKMTFFVLKQIVK